MWRGFHNIWSDRNPSSHRDWTLQRPEEQHTQQKSVTNWEAVLRKSFQGCCSFSLSFSPSLYISSFHSPCACLSFFFLPTYSFFRLPTCLFFKLQDKGSASRCLVLPIQKFVHQFSRTIFTMHFFIVSRSSECMRCLVTRKDRKTSTGCLVTRKNIKTSMGCSVTRKVIKTSIRCIYLNGFNCFLITYSITTLIIL